MSLTLNELLSDLQKSTGFDKEAEDKTDDEKQERKEENDAKDDISKAKKSVDEAAKDVDDAKKKNDADDDKKEQTKEARLQGAALAQEVMSKVAALKKIDTNKEPEMKKEAAAAGKALADALLQKLAEADDVNTIDGVAPGTVPQKNIADNAQLVAEQDAVVKPMPTGDGIHNQGTINQILDSIVADAISQGATSHGQGVEAKAQDAVAAEGAVEDTATPNQVENDEAEKAAAVSALVGDGIDFDSAVDLVKAAAEEIAYDENQQIKQAAIGALLDRGVDFETAVDMIKQAAGLRLPFGKAADGVIAMGKGGLARQAKGLALGGKARAVDAAHDATAMARRHPVAAGALAAGAAGAGTAAAVAAHRSQEKKAALDALFDSGVNFDQAVALVSAKATEIYGA